VVLHGNPAWSFLYRNIIKELCGQFRCTAPDYSGFGLSVAPPGYGFTPAEHAAVIEGFVQELDLSTVTLMVQDLGRSDWVRRRNPSSRPVRAFR
jgi:haloalkane dehalogenase